jgi:serine/threonine protein kinase
VQDVTFHHLNQPRERMKLAIGTVLQRGRYRLEAILGEGGFGITYRASHLYLAQPVVIKTLQEQLRCSEHLPRYREQFLAEARHLACFRHPGIVRVMDCFEEGNLPFIVMEYVPGHTLAALARPGKPLPTDYAIHYVQQVGAALRSVHGKGFIHRDVKPQNIIRRQGTHQVVLIDFGIAHLVTAEVGSPTVKVVSPGYAPLEQYKSPDQAAPTADVYALAATLYHLVTGYPPLAAPLREKEAVSSSQSPSQSPSQSHPQPAFPPGMETALHKGLALDAQNRPQTIREWLMLLPDSEAIRQLSRSRSKGIDSAKTQIISSSRSTSRSTPVRRDFSFRRRLGWTIGVALGLGIGVGAVLRVFQPFLPLLQQEQAFPAQPNWPGAVPLQPSSEQSSPSPMPEEVAPNP